MPQAETLTAAEMCSRLSVGKDTFRRIWRTFPHVFVGQGKDLRSARFLWDIEVLLGVAHGNAQISDSSGDTIRCGGVRRRSKDSVQRRVSQQGGRPPVGAERQKLREYAEQNGLI